jgi:hypothetical protein
MPPVALALAAKVWRIERKQAAVPCDMDICASSVPSLVDFVCDEQICVFFLCFIDSNLIFDMYFFFHASTDANSVAGSEGSLRRFGRSFSGSRQSGTSLPLFHASPGLMMSDTNSL